MRFPNPEYLPHKSVTGRRQIAKREYLTRASERRQDTNQSLLSRLMYSESASNADPGDPWFTKSARGEVQLPKKGEAWTEYQSGDLWRDAKAGRALNTAPRLVRGEEQRESASVHNLTLTKGGFDLMWESFYFAGGKWRARESAGEGANVDANTKKIMVADYEAHHVIPLWLRSASGRPDGDQLDNLAPWHKSAHQTNHAFHHGVPEDVEEATGVGDYREFLPGTSFLLHQLEDGNVAHPAGAPSVKLSGDNEWVTSSGGPIWME